MNKNTGLIKIEKKEESFNLPQSYVDMNRWVRYYNNFDKYISGVIDFYCDDYIFNKKIVEVIYSESIKSKMLFLDL